MRRALNQSTRHHWHQRIAMGAGTHKPRFIAWYSSLRNAHVSD
jgi:hypothetical protein